MFTCRCPSPRRFGLVLGLQFMIVSLLLSACAVTSYSVDGYTSTRAGRYTRDAALLAEVSRVAIVALHGENHAGPDGSSFALVMDVIHEQVLAEIEKVEGVEIVTPEVVAADPVYQAAAMEALPQNQHSPVPGLTDLPLDFTAEQAAELCASLGVDALLFLRFEFDLEFPSWNVANVKTQHQYVLMLPDETEVIWETRSGAWTEAMVPLPSDFTRMFETTFTAEEWETIMKATAEVQLIRSEGGAPIFFLADDIRAAQEGS